MKRLVPPPECRAPQLQQLGVLVCIVDSVTAKSIQHRWKSRQTGSQLLNSFLQLDNDQTAHTDVAKLSKMLKRRWDLAFPVVQSRRIVIRRRKFVRAIFLFCFPLLYCKHSFYCKSNNVMLEYRRSLYITGELPMYSGA